MRRTITIQERAYHNVSLDMFRNNTPESLCGKCEVNVPSQPQMILRMPILLPEYGQMLLPEELQWTMPLLEQAALYQYTKLRLPLHKFMYLTVRSGPVCTTTDDEWHVDGFSMRMPHVPEQDYIWTTDGGTEVIDMPMDFPVDFDPMRHNIHTYINHEYNANKPPIRRLAAETMYCIDPYVLHRRGTVSGERTFVRVSFLPIRIEDNTCTRNPLFPETRNFENRVQTFRNNLLDYHVEKNLLTT